MELFKNIVIITGAVLLLLLVLTLIIAYITYRMAFYSSKKARKQYDMLPDSGQYLDFLEKITVLHEEISSMPYEEVFVKAKDGLTLKGRYYHVSDDAPVEIKFHGYKSSPMKDFCGGNMQGPDTEINALLVEQRAHGQSEGHTISFGVKERYDCLAWVNYILERFGKDKKIILTGVSMGAATVLMASGLPLPENVAGIIADSPYSSPKDIIKKVCQEDMNIPGSLAYPFLYLGARLFGGFDLNESSAVKEIVHCKIPVIIFHGTDDRFVPHQMSREIFKACRLPDSKKRLVETEGAGHVLSFMVDPVSYKNTVAEFKSRVLKG